MNKGTQDIRWIGWMLLILLTAVFLYLFALTDIPPGLTHDEADHGITAWSIVHEGAREIYFTVGYGREPFYDYAVAGMMTFLGSTYFAGRLTAVFFGLITIAGMAAWVRRAFGSTTALVTAAGIVVAFWPLMSARQMLRSVTLPALFVLALLFFWEGVGRVAKGKVAKWQSGNVGLFVVAGILLGVTFYTYMPARALWLMFPLVLVYLGIWQRPLLRKLWWRTGLMLLVMFVVAAPLLLYLQANPTSEVRIQELAAPLTALLRGDFAPLLHNVGDSLRLFILEGDSSWRYNIAGRPLLGSVMGLLFLIGVLVAVWQTWRYRRALVGAASFLALCWLFLGFAPVLVTGPEWAMTQAIGMQPVLYLFPALALTFIGRRLSAQHSSETRLELVESRWWVSLVILLFVFTGIITIRDYFVTWANHPEVRVQYESTMKSALDYLKQNEGIETARTEFVETAVSTITPGEFHTPALVQMTLNTQANDLHYFDARGALLLPQANNSQMILPGFTPLAPPLEPYFSKIELVDTLPLRQTDLDRPLQIYTLDNAVVQADWQNRLTPQNAAFDAAVTLLGYDLQTPQAAPGDEIVLVTWWQVQRPLPTAMLFTHIQGADGIPIAQMDKLDVPGEMWQVGDMFLQVHQIRLGEETAVGTYPVAVGVYTQTDGQRLTLPDGSDLLPITQIEVTE